MKTFEDLQFEDRFFGGVAARIEFDNGLLISVVAGEAAYSTPRQNHPNPDFFSKFEVAIMDDGEFVTKQFVAELVDDVLGWQDRDQITALMSLVQNHG